MFEFWLLDGLRFGFSSLCAYLVVGKTCFCHFNECFGVCICVHMHMCASVCKFGLETTNKILNICLLLAAYWKSFYTQGKRYS